MSYAVLLLFTERLYVIALCSLQVPAVLDANFPGVCVCRFVSDATVPSAKITESQVRGRWRSWVVVAVGDIGEAWPFMDAPSLCLLAVACCLLRGLWI